ncbi:jg13770 [Pararge aegeria aegeria]|uniref:Jg13770 protein n=1 Tax=Pararge aegeria aegeria TaxID=348720 RepID=A0A8S4QQ24_9NEOP|nr:jg13770 [Pararge aegeria aegeria]
MGHRHSLENRWTLGFQGAGMGTSYHRSVGRPRTRWTDDIKRVARRRWTQAAQACGIWNSLPKNYIQQWLTLVDLIKMILIIVYCSGQQNNLPARCLKISSVNSVSRRVSKAVGSGLS